MCLFHLRSNVTFKSDKILGRKSRFLCVYLCFKSYLCLVVNFSRLQLDWKNLLTFYSWKNLTCIFASNHSITLRILHVLGLGLQDRKLLKSVDTQVLHSSKQLVVLLPKWIKWKNFQMKTSTNTFNFVTNNDDHMT